MKLAVIAVLSVIIVSGCSQTYNTNQTSQNQTEQVPVPSNASLSANPVQTCIGYCYQLLASGADLSRGPCILNPISEQPSWVCDVAHYPRADVDNLPENQCSSYGETASHFVEVTPQCQFIRAV